jgi:hypothetical protein
MMRDGGSNNEPTRKVRSRHAGEAAAGLALERCKAIVRSWGGAAGRTARRRMLMGQIRGPTLEALLSAREAHAALGLLALDYAPHATSRGRSTQPRGAGIIPPAT